MRTDVPAAANGKRSLWQGRHHGNQPDASASRRATNDDCSDRIINRSYTNDPRRHAGDTVWPDHRPRYVTHSIPYRAQILGHKAGDQVLIEVAKRLGHTIRGGDTLARLGGDEFVMLLLGLKNREECVVTLKRILEAVALPILIKEQTQSVSASIGVSFYPLDEDHDILLRHADQAMYMAKQSGKNRFHIYDSEVD